MNAAKVTLAQINGFDRSAFVTALGHLFEHSPWVAEETWSRRPFRDVAHLHSELCATMRAAGKERQLALIRAHPDLAGRLAQQRKLSQESAREQASAGLTTLTEQETTTFQAMNAAYLQRFGFPFVICARLNAKSAIVDAMTARLRNDAEQEFETALAEIEKIARLRLADALRTENLPVQ